MTGSALETTDVLEDAVTLRLLRCLVNFAVAEGVSLREIQVNEKVEFVLVVDWEKKPTQWIAEIATLPAETELDFGNATEDIP